MHDDQHGTAIISAAGLLNALEVAGKKIEEVKIVVSGAGAAAISCTKMYMALGALKENIVMLDSHGVITSDRPNLTEQKRLLLPTAGTYIHSRKPFAAPTCSSAFERQCAEQGYGSEHEQTPHNLLRSPTRYPKYHTRTHARGMPRLPDKHRRSDYPNQINNVLCFPTCFAVRLILPQRVLTRNETRCRARTCRFGQASRARHREP